MLELRVSALPETAMVSVGYGEAGAALPRESRVLELCVGEMVALSLVRRFDDAGACGREPLFELDALIEDAERILAITEIRRPAGGDGDGRGL